MSASISAPCGSASGLGGAGNELAQKVGNILLTFGHEGLIIASAAAERHHDRFSASRQRHSAQRAEAD
jgi:hypothetical protein